jgi:hypothetical protein
MSRRDPKLSWTPLAQRRHVEIRQIEVSPVTLTPQADVEIGHQCASRGDPMR